MLAKHSIYHNALQIITHYLKHNLNNFQMNTGDKVFNFN